MNDQRCEDDLWKTQQEITDEMVDNAVKNSAKVKKETTKWFIDEPDLGNMDCPLTGYCKGQKLYDTENEAGLEAARMSAEAEICFCAWPIEVTALFPHK